MTSLKMYKVVSLPVGVAVTYEQVLETPAHKSNEGLWVWVAGTFKRDTAALECKGQLKEQARFLFRKSLTLPSAAPC